jgi:GNAT superfamily N-acetyltransferase
MIPIQRIQLPAPGIKQLHTEAREEGYDFIETLIDEWTTGANRFEAPGEILYGHLDHGLLVAVGGLTIDPFEAQLNTGRIRRVYVRSTWRKKGIGRALVFALIEHAEKNFRCVRLRAENADAARLYESMGFVPIDNPAATHILVFNK